MVALRSQRATRPSKEDEEKLVLETDRISEMLDEWGVQLVRLPTPMGLFLTEEFSCSFLMATPCESRALNFAKAPPKVFLVSSVEEDLDVFEVKAEAEAEVEAEVEGVPRISPSNVHLEPLLKRRKGLELM